MIIIVQSLIYLKCNAQQEIWYIVFTSLNLSDTGYHAGVQRNNMSILRHMELINIYFETWLINILGVSEESRVESTSCIFFKVALTAHQQSLA